MIDLDNLIDLLPPYFKDKDTYKDGNNKGLLEKFLNICGSYLKNKPLVDLEEFIDAHNAGKVDDLYINYLWGFLGEFPFLQSVFYNQESFINTFEGFNLAKAKNISRVEPKSLLKITNSEYSIRDILPYVIKLYQIRGTKTFFDVVFRLYNLDTYIKQVDTYDGLSSKAKSLLPRDIYGTSNNHYTSQYEPRMDGSESFDDTTNKYDNYFKCNTCMTSFFEVIVPQLSTEDESFYIQAVINLIEKFVPYYVKPIIVFPERPNDYVVRGTFRVRGSSNLVQGIIPPSDITYTDVNGSPKSKDPRLFPSAINSQVIVETTVITTPLALKGYQVGYKDTPTSDVVWGDEVHTDSLYIITKPGIYCFRPVGVTKTDYTTIVVGLINIAFKYFLYMEDGETRPLTNLGDTLSVKFIGGGLYTSYYQEPGKDTTVTNLYQYTPQNIILAYKPNDPHAVVSDDGVEGITHKFTLNWPGEYGFQLSTNTSNTYRLKILASEGFQQDLESSLLKVEPLTLYVRNGNYSKGSGIYSSNDFYNRGIRGVYELKGSQYVPHDYNLDIEAVDGFGDPQPITVKDNLGNTKTYEPNSEGKYEFTLPKDNRNWVFNISTDNSTTITVRIVLIDDPIQLEVSPEYLIMTPNRSEGTYEANTDNLVTLVTKASLLITSGNSNQVKQYKPYVLLTTKSTYNNNSEQVLKGNLVGEEFRDSSNKLIGYLIPLGYNSGGSNKNDPAIYSHSGITVNLKTLLGNSHTTGTVIARLVTVTEDSSGNWVYSTKSLTQYNSDQTTLNFVLPSLSYYGFFTLESKDHWSSLNQSTLPSYITSQGDYYVLGDFGFEAGQDIIEEGTPVTIYPIVATLLNSSDTVISDLSLMMDGKPVPCNDLNNLGDVKKGGKTFQMPFLPLNETYRTYAFHLYEGDTIINNRVFGVHLFAPPLASGIQVITPGYSMGSDSTGKYISVSLEEKPNISLDFIVESNRTKPPYTVHYGAYTTIKTSDTGTFSLQIDTTSDGVEVWVDLQVDGSKSLSIDPSFRIRVGSSGGTPTPPPVEPDPVDPPVEPDFSKTIQVTPTSLSWSSSEEGKTKTLNINISDQATLDAIDHLEITEQ